MAIPIKIAEAEMTDHNRISNMARREALGTLAAGATLLMTGAPALAQRDKPITGIIPVSTTPYTATGEIDYEDLAKEMAFYERCGANGAVWPQGGSDAPLLSKDERMKGMEVIANACKPLKLAAVLAIQGSSQQEMLDYAAKAESLNADAMMVQPPAGNQTADALYAYFSPLGGITKKPVIVQPTPQGVPSLEVILRLAKDFPNFGYIKEEGTPVPEHMRADMAAKPAVKAVFGAAGGVGFLYEASIGSDGESTALGAYADLTVALLKAYKSGKKDVAADAFSKLLLMMNCETEIPGTMRYVFVKRGVFKTMVARKRPAAGQPVTSAAIVLTPEQTAEIDLRYATLKPYLARGA
jgi:4-hydroxy-tetrahydrodipicolinate synthase